MIPDREQRKDRAARLAAGLAVMLLVTCSVLPVSSFAASAEGSPANRAFAFRPEALSAIDNAIGEAIARREIPGAVLWVESHGENYHRAYGHRALVPAAEAMTEDTLFDLASLTKVLATTPAVLKLIEDGAIDLDSPVITWLPELAGDTDRERITLRQLLTHTSGLIPVVRRRDPWWGYGAGIARAADSEMWGKPGEKWRYSDVNFILLGEIVRRVSGRRLDQFVWEEIHQPLGMNDTGFGPQFAARDWIAPTEDRRAYGLIRGIVHDPVARRMEGVAGHAGLFSTVSDIARLLRAQLNGGQLEEVRIFQPATVTLMTSVQTPPEISAKRGLGWDIGSPYSGQRGSRFPVGGYGHTGWTGTCVWVDPGSKTFYILLSNRNHPSESGKIKKLRHTIGSLVAEAVGIEDPASASAAAAASAASTTNTTGDTEPVQLPAPAAGGDETVLNGIDALAAGGFAELDGSRVGLVTNHTGIDRKGRPTIDLLAAAKNVELVALFSPEHGIRGKLDTKNISDEVDERTGLPIYSLYKSDNRKPSKAQLAGIDTLVFDIQDIGCRFYTYVATMGNAMEAAAENDLKFVVLDRINPIGGHRVEGPVRDGPQKFVAWHEIPVRHGMTVGELAGMFATEKQLDLDLTVIPVRNWRRAQYFDATGMPWVNPSPNMRSLTEALLYPGIGLLEFTNISVGRGTDSPFEKIGAPWIDDQVLARQLNGAGLRGIRFTPVRFTPEASVHVGAKCGGVKFTITDRELCRPIDVGLTIAAALHRLYPDKYNLAEKFNVLLLHPATAAAVAAGKTLEEIQQGWSKDRKRFADRRAKFLLYD